MSIVKTNKVCFRKCEQKKMKLHIKIKSILEAEKLNKWWRIICYIA